MKTVKKNIIPDKNGRDFINGLMLDPARIPLQFQWYERFIPWMAKWGYNTLLLNLADDTGCAIRFKCRPELATHLALTHAQVRRLIVLTAAHKITLVPLIATLGHTGYIFWRDAYRRLGDGLKEPGRHVLCPARAESKKIIGEIIEEILELFPGPYIHIGLDEAGELPKKTCRYCQKKFAGQTEADFVVRHLQWLGGLAARRQKQVMYWALNTLNVKRDAVIAAGAPDTAVGCVWQYDERKIYTDDTAIKFYIKARRQVIGVPALACSPNTTILPNQHNLDNIRRFAAVIHQLRKHPEVRGLINCIWQHIYTLPGTLIYGMAYAADQFHQPGGTCGFPGRFARSFFGAPAASSIGRLLRQLHAGAPQFQDMKHLIDCCAPANLAALEPDTCRRAKSMGRKAQGIARELRQERRSVAYNRDIYDAYILAADTMAHIGDRAAILARKNPGRAALRRLADRARALADRAWAAWDTTYDPAHPCRKLRFPQDAPVPPATPVPPPVNIDRYCYFGTGNKHVFRSLEKSAVFLRSLADGRKTNLLV